MLQFRNAHHKIAAVVRPIKITIMLGILVFITFAPLGIKPALAVSCSKYHVVQAGDSLSGLAQTYGVKLEDLAAANNLTSPYVIYIGQSLCIPATTTVSTGTSGTTTTSTSKKPTLLIINYTRKVFVEVTNFPKNTTYYVRAGNRNEWVRIGRLRTNKDGKASDIFRLPAPISKFSPVTICLKNVITEVIVCQTIIR